MTINGLGSVVEIASESRPSQSQGTYGTDLAKTTSVPFNSETFTARSERVRGEAIRYNNALGVTADTKVSHKIVEGNIAFPLWDKGLLLWFESVYEDYAFAAASPNTHTFLIGAQGATHPSIAADALMGGTTTVPSKTVTGIVANGYTISGAVEDSTPLVAEFDCIAKDLVYNSSDTAAGVEVATLEHFTWAGTTVTLGGSGECVQDFSMTVAIPKVRRWCLGQTTTDQPDREGRASVTGSFTLYFENWDEANDARLGTNQALVITAAEIGTPSTNHQYEWTNNIEITEAHATVDGENRIMVDAQWTALSSTVNDQDASGHTLVVSSTDATL